MENNNNNKMSEQQINMITSDPTFIKTAGVLASKLHISLMDARQELLIELLEHRYHTLQDFGTTLNGKQHRDMVFARKDLERKTFNYENATMKLFQPDTNSDGRSIVENLEVTPVQGTSYSDDEINRVLALAPSIFGEASTRYVTAVLTLGASEAMEQLGMTKRQFDNHMRNVMKTLADGGRAREKADRLLVSDAQIMRSENVKKAEQFLEMIDQGAPSVWIQKWLTEALDNPYFDKCFDATKYPGKMVRAFDTTETRRDSYHFVEEIERIVSKNQG